MAFALCGRVLTRSLSGAASRMIRRQRSRRRRSQLLGCRCCRSRRDATESSRDGFDCGRLTLDEVASVPEEQHAEEEINGCRGTDAGAHAVMEDRKSVV